MIANNVYYEVAGHVFALEGEHDGMNKLPEFGCFTAPSPIDVGSSIRLRSGSDSKLEGDTYYSLDTALMSCRFIAHESGYGMRLTSLDGGEILSLRYDSADRTSEISGHLNPRAVKFALWVAFGMSVLEQHTVAIHASAVVHGGKAVLFLGESGTGKSTHARLWQEHIPKVTLLNDDSPVLRIERGKCSVYGSPWSGKTPCYRQAKAELAAIVRLSQATENRIFPLNLHEAIGALLPSFPPSFSMHPKLAEPIYGMLSEVLRQTPVYLLECRPDKQAVELAYEAIYPERSPRKKLRLDDEDIA